MQGMLWMAGTRAAGGRASSSAPLTTTSACSSQVQPCFLHKHFTAALIQTQSACQPVLLKLRCCCAYGCMHSTVLITGLAPASVLTAHMVACHSHNLALMQMPAVEPTHAHAATPNEPPEDFHVYQQEIDTGQSEVKRVRCVSDAGTALSWILTGLCLEHLDHLKS